MQTKQDILKGCTIDGLIVKLPPGQLERKLYQEVAKSLNLIGGKWVGGKTMGFVFNEPPGDLLAQISQGTKVNIQKEYQFFATSDKLADELVNVADIREFDLILEPSAGQGAIIKAIHRKHPGHLVHYCELMALNRSVLAKLKDVQYITDNFLKLGQSEVTTGIFHKIIANPPFSKNQDIDHILQMWGCLAPGGRIVTIASKHWQISGNKKETKFKSFLYEVGADIQEVPAGEFKESGTNIATVILTIDKPING